MAILFTEKELFTRILESRHVDKIVCCICATEINPHFLFHFQNKELRHILTVEILYTDPFRSFGNVRTRDPML